MRERIRQRWPMLDYYLDLARHAPRAAWTAFEKVLAALGILVVVALWFNRPIGEALLRWDGIDPAWAVVAALFLALYYLMRLNFMRVTELKDRALKLELESRADTMKDINRSLRQFAFEAVIDHVKAGREEVLVPLHDDPQPSEAWWTARVDAWDAKGARLLEQWWKPEDLAAYTRDTGLVGHVSDWQQRLLAYVTIKVERLLEIAKGKSKYADD